MGKVVHRGFQAAGLNDQDGPVTFGSDKIESKDSCHKGAHCSTPIRVGAVGREPNTLLSNYLRHTLLRGPVSPGAHARAVEMVSSTQALCV